MKCQACDADFPSSIRVEGKQYVFSSRKHCLSCVPFGKRRGVSLGTEIACEECERVYLFDKKKGHTVTVCNSCFVNKRRTAQKKKAIQHLGGSCQVCGYKKSTRSLVFHHIDASKKDFQISSRIMSWKRIEEELSKCALLCSNCHGEVHEGITRL